MPSPILPISNHPSSASAATMLLKAEIDPDPSTSLLISSQFDTEKAIPIKPLLPRASSYNSTSNVNNSNAFINYQQRRRRTASDSSLALLADESPRQSISREVGHAAAETFLITRLSLKLLRYLGYPSFVVKLLSF